MRVPALLGGVYHANTATYFAAVEGFGDIESLKKVRKGLAASREAVWGGKTKVLKQIGTKLKTHKCEPYP